MEQLPPPLTVLLVEDDDTIKRAVSGIAERCEVELLRPETCAADAIASAGRHRPGAIVVDLDLSGVLGLRIVPALLVASPGSAVIAISPFEGLRDKVLEAGAVAMFDPSDLRLLDACLRWVRATPPGEDCPADRELRGPASTSRLWRHD